MAAPRATQFISLRNLSRGSHQVRNLHMTGPQTYASPVLTKERPVLNLPRDIAGLRAECKKRKIDASGSKQDVRTLITHCILTYPPNSPNSSSPVSTQTNSPTPAPSQPQQPNQNDPQRPSPTLPNQSATSTPPAPSKPWATQAQSTSPTSPPPPSQKKSKKSSASPSSPATTGTPPPTLPPSKRTPTPSP